MSIWKKMANQFGSIMNDLTGVTDSTEKNKDLMDYQNDYNLPVNQMARLTQAGLNPNLVYGSGGASVMSASPSGVGKQNGVLDNLFSLPLQILSTKAELEKNKKEQDLLAEQTLLTNQNSLRTIASTEYVKEQGNYLKQQTEKLKNVNEFYKEHGYFPPTGESPAFSKYDTGLAEDILGAIYRGIENYENRNRN